MTKKHQSDPVHVTLTRQFDLEMIAGSDRTCELSHRHPETGNTPVEGPQAYWLIGGVGSRQTVCVCHTCARYLMNELSQLNSTAETNDACDDSGSCEDADHPSEIPSDARRGSD